MPQIPAQDPQELAKLCSPKMDWGPGLTNSSFSWTQQQSTACPRRSMHYCQGNSDSEGYDSYFLDKIYKDNSQDFFYLGKNLKIQSYEPSFKPDIKPSSIQPTTYHGSSIIPTKPDQCSSSNDRCRPDWHPSAGHHQTDQSPSVCQHRMDHPPSAACNVYNSTAWDTIINTNNIKTQSDLASPTRSCNWFQSWPSTKRQVCLQISLGHEWCRFMICHQCIPTKGATSNSSPVQPCCVAQCDSLSIYKKEMKGQWALGLCFHVYDTQQDMPALLCPKNDLWLPHTQQADWINLLEPYSYFEVYLWVPSQLCLFHQD
jgi:hypothetical protein